MKYITNCYFGGVFPRKGKRCAKINGGGWIPVPAEGLAIVSPRYSGAHYIPLDCIKGGFSKEALPVGSWFISQRDGKTIMVYPNKMDVPVIMDRDWRKYPEDDWLRKGERIFTSDPGNDAFPAIHYILERVVK